MNDALRERTLPPSRSRTRRGRRADRLSGSARLRRPGDTHSRGVSGWTIDVPRPRGVAAAGERLFLASTPSDGQSTVLAVDGAGTERWRRAFEAGIGALAPAHDRLYAGTNDGRVLAFA